VKVSFTDAESRSARFLDGPVHQTSFGEAQYRWNPGKPAGHADPDAPPVRSVVNGGADTLYQLPRASLTVISGNLAGAQ